jgi:hypothetical protein
MNLHGLDPRILIDAMRLVVDGWRVYRSERNQSEPEKKEKVLEEAVKNAEQMSARGDNAEKVLSEVGTRLEKELGLAAKEDVFERVASILAVVRPFDVDAFRYFDNLAATIFAAREFCKIANVFQLRARTVNGIEYLPLPKFAQSLNVLFNETNAFRAGERPPHIVELTIGETEAYLSSGKENLSVVVPIRIRESVLVGRILTSNDRFELILGEGSSVNRIVFRAGRQPASLNLTEVDILLLGDDFRKLTESLLSDLEDYIRELSEEQRSFRDRFAPALLGIRLALKKLNSA